MGRAKYHDVVWDFVLEKPAEDLFLLRVLTSEDLVYTDYSYKSGETFWVHLPLDDMAKECATEQQRGLMRIGGDEVRRTGRRLWDALPKSATEPLREPPPDGEPELRLKIVSTRSQIAGLPWEFLNDGEGPPVALQPHVHLARSIPVQVRTPAITTVPPVRVLLVLTNPKESRLLDAEQEIEAVRGSLVPPSYELHVWSEPTVAALADELHEFNPHIVHYIGHAGISSGVGHIILHDDQGGTYWLSPGNLAQIMPPSVRLLCLGTCFSAPNYRIGGLSRLAYTDCDQRFPSVIANQYPLGERAVRMFWDRFYSDLAEQRGDVNQAVHAARQATAEGEPYFADWASFVLVIRDQTGQALRIQPPQVGGPLQGLADRQREQAAVLQARYAGRLVDQLAQQLLSLGDDAPQELRDQYEHELKRTEDLMEELDAEEEW